MTIQVGLTAEVEQVVTQELTADTLGNKGVQVFATPYAVCLMETAAEAAIVSHLPPGAGTVGTTVEATLVETGGKRCLFQVDVFDEVEKIAEGRHERFVVPNLGKFLARAMSKGRSAS